MLRITLAALHLLALGIGFGAVIGRAFALRQRPATAESLRRAFHFDTQWGIAAGLWIATGLWRWLGSVEKSASYYNTNHVFYAKMTFLALILALEIWPIVTLIRWRAALGKGGAAGDVAAPAALARIATISRVQAVLVVLMVFAAVAMARGFGARG